MGSPTRIATIWWCSNQIFTSSSNPKANFCLSYSSFSTHLMPLLSNQSGCKNCPHFLQCVESCKCTQRQLWWCKWPQDVVLMSMYGNQLPQTTQGSISKLAGSIF
jgi:hypothetical protein